MPHLSFIVGRRTARRTIELGAWIGRALPRRAVNTVHGERRAVHGAVRAVHHVTVLQTLELARQPLVLARKCLLLLTTLIT